MHKSLVARTSAVSGALMECRGALCKSYGTGEEQGMVTPPPADGAQQLPVPDALHAH